MTRSLTLEEQNYNRDFLLCDQMWAFHPDVFDVLDERELSDLKRYYPQDLDDLSDVFAYRAELLVSDSGLMERARTALARAVITIGISLDS